jgi:glycosyltransferase involved in cell wall biosynthesis
MPKVSVIMSVYNGSDYLDQAIKSVLEQTFIDFEFLIVDDASTDSSLGIISTWAEKDQRIRIIRNEQNIGLTRSLNKAVGLSIGEYIARIDADDVCHPERLVKQVQYLDTHLSVGLVGSWAYKIDQLGKTLGQLKYPTDGNVIKQKLIRYNLFIHSSIMVRRELLNILGGYNSDFRYAQDYDLYFRLLNICELSNIPEFLISSRYSDGSITRSKNRRQTACAIKARIRAIRSGLYPLYSYIYLTRPILGILIGPDVKRLLVRLSFKT